MTKGDIDGYWKLEDVVRRDNEQIVKDMKTELENNNNNEEENDKILATSYVISLIYDLFFSCLVSLLQGQVYLWKKNGSPPEYALIMEKAKVWTNYDLVDQFSDSAFSRCG